jgi:hypothetical protein
MAEVQKGSPQREIIPEKPNQVVSMTEVKMYAFRFTDSGGAVDVGLALCFGKDAEDGGTGIWCVSPQDIKAALKLPSAYIKKGLRKRLAQAEQEAELPSADLPEEI